MLKKYLKSILIPTIMCCAAFSANSAVITFQGTLGAAQDGSILIDFYSLSLASESTVTITAEGEGAGIDIGNGISDLDTFVFIAVDDGDRTLDDYLFDDDDGGIGFDSLLSATLLAGDYLVGISSCCISPDEFVAGSNLSLPANLFSIPDYILTIDDGVSVEAVPAPSAFVLLALSILGLVARKTV
jgi:hypothetical protein